MARNWGQVLSPQGAPLWAVVVGNLSLAIVLGGLTLTLLPKTLAAALPKPVRRLRNRLLGYGRHLAQLTAQGPFFRLMVYCGRRFFGGGLSTSCKAPRVLRLKPIGCSEVQLSFTPTLPSVNPFHEEDYVVAWRAARDSKALAKDENLGEDAWIEKQFKKGPDFELEGERVRLILEGLPEAAALGVRVRAANGWGLGEWSSEVTSATLARPSKDGGATGPLGPAYAGGGKRLFHWGQTQTEVSIKVPIGEIKTKDLRFKALPSRLEIRSAEPSGGSDEKDLLVGPMAKKVKADEVFWTVEEDDKLGRVISVQMVKAEAYEKWPCLIEADGHTRIDVRLVRFFTEGMAGMAGLGGLDIWQDK